MKIYCALLLSGALALPLSGSPVAQVRLTCTSLRFLPATGGPGQAETLSFTTDFSFNEINNELAPMPDPTLPSHGSYFRLDDPTTAENITGRIAFDEPPPVDANGDGFDDFFQLEQGAAATTTQGLFTTPVDNGTVSATWSRAAGSSTGNCLLRLTSQTFGKLPDFNVTFELLTYSGTLAYTPATNAITGLLTLAATQDSSQTLTGLVTLVRVATNRFDRLTWPAGSLTNHAGQVLSYSTTEIDRDTELKTNYFGYLDFADGDLSTGTVDYWDWIVSIDDVNDSNGNGIPDLSDDAGAAGNLPSLSLTRAKDSLQLSIQGVTGSAYQLESKTSLTQTNWAGGASVTLTNNPQVLALPIPTSPSQFWRLRLP